MIHLHRHHPFHYHSIAIGLAVLAAIFVLLLVTSAAGIAGEADLPPDGPPSTGRPAGVPLVRAEQE
jgi:hypothetical protein